MTIVTYKRSGESKVEELFYRGEYARVLSELFETAPDQKENVHLIYQVSSMALLGRPAKAEKTFERLSGGMTLAQRIEIRYHLGIGFGIISNYAKCRQYFGANVKLKNSVDEPRLLFYIYLGLAHYHFLRSRFKSSLTYAQEAYKHAIKIEFYYGILLSKTLQSHSTIRMGKISQGYNLLNEVKSLASEMGAVSIVKSLHLSLLTYRIRFGREINFNLSVLLKKLEEFDLQEPFNMSYLMLEAAADQILRGNSNQAFEFLRSASQMIFESRHSRQEVKLYFKYCYLHYLDARYDRALEILDNANSNLDNEVDTLLILEYLGLKYRIKSKVNPEDKELKEIKERIDYLRHFSGEAIGQRILHREGLDDPPGLKLGDDRIGDLKDQIHKSKKKSELLEAVFESGYFSLFRDIIPHEEKSANLAINFLKDKIIYINGPTAKILDFNPNLGIIKFLRKSKNLSEIVKAKDKMEVTKLVEFIGDIRLFLTPKGDDFVLSKKITVVDGSKS